MVLAFIRFLRSRPLRGPCYRRDPPAAPSAQPTLCARSPSLPKLSQDAVDTALAHWLSTATATGRPSLDISEGALHARVGSTQQQPACCDAMRKLFDKAIDTLLSGPASGYSSALCIRYKLPRP